MTKFVHIRELKNQTTALLREVEAGTTLIVTRRGKPIATMKPFETSDVHSGQPSYPTTMYDMLRKHIEGRYPELKHRSLEEKQHDFEQLSCKLRQDLPFQNWQEMDRAAKGDRYGLSR